MKFNFTDTLHLFGTIIFYGFCVGINTIIPGLGLLILIWTGKFDI